MTVASDVENRLVSVTINSQTIRFVYNADGNMVENINPHNSTTIHALGSAVRDQLTDASGAVTYARAYDPYGVVTTTRGPSQTPYGFTAEYPSNDLVYLRARHYAPSMGRFLTRDTWGGNANMPMSFNRWAYVNGNPVNYVDPLGLFGELYVKFDKDAGAPDWTPYEQLNVALTAGKIAEAYSNAYNRETIRRYSEYCGGGLSSIVPSDLLEPWEAFYYIHRGRVTFTRKSYSCSGCWAETRAYNSIWMFKNAEIEDWRFITHEFGHAFESGLWDALRIPGVAQWRQKIGRNALTESLWWRTYEGEQYGGFADGLYKWQWNPDEGPYNNNGTPDTTADDTDGRGEIFADMFVGWIWNRWEPSSSGAGWSPKGQERADFMASNMDTWIYEIVSKRRAGIGPLLSVIHSPYAVLGKLKV